MTDGFGSPVLGGGGNLLRPSEQSPDYSPGVAGWAIRRNGTVEFNNGTFRGTVTAGTFQGTNFNITTAGEFFYSGIPAAGNLIASIAPGAGADAFGNNYLGGYTTYDRVAGSFTNLANGVLTIGPLAAGTPDTAHSGTFSASGTASLLHSPPTAAIPAIANFALNSGASDPVLAADSPMANFYSSSGVPMFVGVMGALVALDPAIGPALTPYKNQVPALVAGWTVAGFAGDQTLQYRIDGMDNIILDGEVTTPAVAAGTTTSILSVPLAAPYIPKKGRRFPIYQSTGAAGTYASGIIHSDGNIFVQNPTALALGAIIGFEVSIPLGNLT